MAAFPGSLAAHEFNCLEGTRDRQQLVLIDLQIKFLSPLERSVVGAHQHCLEKTRQQISAFFPDNVQPYISPTIELLQGFPSDKSQAFNACNSN